ncbi:MAG: type II secretion system F family protein [Firmicutes bacterium]|nr:type II secretion system F family protein [Bacillota bacterium]
MTVGPWLPAVLVLAAAASLAGALGPARPPGPRALRARLLGPVRRRAREAAAPRERISPERRLLLLVGRRLARLRIAGVLEAELAGADVPLRGEEFLGAVVLAALGGGCAGLLLLRSLPAAAGLALVGAAVPFLMLLRARASRLARFEARLPDALALMASGLRAGFPFVQTLDMVRSEIPGPVGREFGRTFREIQLGAQTEEALADLTARVRSAELDLVVTAVLIQREVGGNLAEVLDNIAGTVRDRLRLRREMRALTASGRLSGWVIGLLPLAVGAFILVFNPGYFRVMVDSTGGKVALALAAAGEVLGALVIRRIVNPEV